MHGGKFLTISRDIVEDVKEKYVRKLPNASLSETTINLTQRHDFETQRGILPREESQRDT